MAGDDVVVDIDPVSPTIFDGLANKDHLTLSDVLYLKTHWPEPNPDVAAANLAIRVQRAPQFCRFMTFEKMNLLRLYQLQHQILTFEPEKKVTPVVDPANPDEPDPAVSEGVYGSGAVHPLERSSVLHPVVQQPDPGPSSSSQFMSSMPSSSFDPRAKKSPYDDIPESIGLHDNRLDPALCALLKEYNEALTTFHALQSWPRATESSTTLARSDFAFHFRSEKYIRSRETMYDLSPASGPSKTDGVRQWLVAKLPLKYVNPNAWNERRTAGESAKGGVGVPGNLARTKTAADLRDISTIPVFIDDLARILVAVAAALFLLVPMIVLSFITSQRARLGTTVAFVIVFAVVLGRASNATNDALMGATAAYAAVLVVFVGQTVPIR